MSDAHLALAAAAPDPAHAAMEARLRDSEEQFRSFAEGLADVAFVVDAQGAPLWWNRRHQELFGVGQGMAHVAEMCHPEDVERVMEAWVAAAAVGEPVHIDCRLMCEDGGYRPFESHVVPVKDPSGAVLRWCGLCRDVSEAHARDRVQRFLLDLGAKLRGEASPERILEIAQRALGEHLQADRVGYAEVLADDLHMVVQNPWAAPDLQPIVGQFAMGNLGPALADYRAGHTRVSPDLAATGEMLPMLIAMQIAASVTVPLIRADRLSAVISVQQRVPRAWTAEEVQVIQEVAERTWEALERARAEARLRESEEQFRGLAENLPHLCYVAATDGRILWANERWRSYYAAFPKTAEGQPDGAIHPEDAAGAAALWNRARLLGQPITGLVRMMGSDGVYRPMHSHAAPILGEGGRVLRWCGIQTDLSEQVAREARQAFLFELGEALRQESDPDAQLSLAARRLGTFLDADVTGFSEVDDVCAVMTNGHEWVQGVLPGFAGEMRFDAFGPSETMAALAAGTPLLAGDVARDLEGDAMCEPCLRFGVRAAIAVPVYVDGRLRAILYVDHSAPMPWGEAELELVRDVAERTWAAAERAKAEAAQRESQALLGAIMTNAPVGIYVKDTAGRYVMVNGEMGRMLGRAPETLIGRTVTEAFGDEVASAVEARDRHVLETGETVTQQRPLITGPDGTGVFALSTRFPVRARPGAPPQVAAISIDLSAQKLAEAELERSREALHQSEKLTALGSLLAGVSHELNNPLSIVVAQAVMMERQAQAGALAERAKQIRAAADRCARIVQTFLAMARQRKPQRRRVDLNAVADAALELTAYGLRTSGMRLVREQAARLPSISADADQLHQVIINLVINAQQAMQEQEAERVLTVRTFPSPDGGEVVLEIGDSGPGVPDELRGRIFEPFFTTKPQEVGTGVGLSFSQGLVEAHGGRLELAEGEVGRGAMFRITLPVGVAEEPIVAPAAMVAAARTGRTALVVDDEPQIARALAEFLELEGYVCDTAFGGAEAKLRLAAVDYDLIVSDLRMPDVDGPSLFAWIKAEKPALAKRVAFATGDTLGATAVRFLAREGRPFMEKPFTPESLRTLLDDLQACA